MNYNQKSVTNFFQTYLEELGLGTLLNVVQNQNQKFVFQMETRTFEGEFVGKEFFLLNLYNDEDEYKEEILLTYSQSNCGELNFNPQAYRIWCFGDLQSVDLNKPYAYYIDDENKKYYPLKELFFNSKLVELNKFLKPETTV